MVDFEKLLSGGDLRSIGKSESVILSVKNQNDFDELFKCLFHKDRLVVMRAADAIEKITVKQQQYLLAHKKEIIQLCKVAKDKELKWHLCLLIPRLALEEVEFYECWRMLTNWAKEKSDSKIVRVNSIQGLYEMMQRDSGLKNEFDLILREIEKEKVPSISARIQKLQKGNFKK